MGDKTTACLRASAVPSFHSSCAHAANGELRMVRELLAQEGLLREEGKEAEIPERGVGAQGKE